MGGYEPAVLFLTDGDSLSRRQYKQILRVGEAAPEKLAATAIAVKHIAASGPTGGKPRSTRKGHELAHRFVECPLRADIVAKVFLGCRTKILRAADALC